MKIVIASDSFKGSNNTLKVADTIEKGITKVFQKAEVIKIPIADGGEGTVEALVAGANGILQDVDVIGPMGEKLTARYGILKDKTAVIEMAAASGLPLVPEDKRNPMIATSYGTGQLIKAALDNGCRKIIMGIGGSATNDGGLGMAQALGISFRDKDGNELEYGGGSLEYLHTIDSSGMDKRLKECEIIIACDVSNTLCGPKGASAVYGPQKGATPEMVKKLDSNLKNLAEKIKEDTKKDIINLPGTGASGGLAVPLLAYAHAELKSGIESVLDTLEFDKYLSSADLVITGEGKIDGQSIYGKVPVGVAKRAKKYNLPVLAIVGDIGEGAEAVYNYGVDGIMSTVNKAMPLSEAMKHSTELLEDAAERLMRFIKIGMKIK